MAPYDSAKLESSDLLALVVVRVGGAQRCEYFRLPTNLTKRLADMSLLCMDSRQWPGSPTGLRSERNCSRRQAAKTPATNSDPLITECTGDSLWT